jgi:hypothetical protein
MFVYHQRVSPIKLHIKHVVYEAFLLTMWKGYISKHATIYSKVIFNMVNKIMEHHVFPSFVKSITIVITFNLWMSQKDLRLLLWWSITLTKCEFLVTIL